MRCDHRHEQIVMAMLPMCEAESKPSLEPPYDHDHNASGEALQFLVERRQFAQTLNIISVLHNPEEFPAAIYHTSITRLALNIWRISAIFEMVEGRF